ncbi:MAG: hypothetical protein IKU10_07385, partial [Clostridia bacterium]|nr:hypothetical protein [Clostridia bacterium]
MKNVLSFLLCFALLGAMVIPCQAADTIYGMTAETFFASDDTELPYRFYKPEGDAPQNGYAVYVHLHGIGECGNDNEDQLSVGMEL